MSQLAIIENGPTLWSFFGRALDRAGIPYKRVPVCRGADFPRDFEACILTGDFHNVSDGLKGYHRRELDFLEKLDGRRAFASCFSHQLIATAHGGRVARRDGRLLRWEKVALERAHPAFGSVAGFDAVCLNVDEVVGVPPGATLHGTSERCGCQVLSYGSDILTCQAHPEMSVRKGHRLVNALALALAGGPGSRYAEYRSSLPSDLPEHNAFLSSVLRWLTQGQTRN